jgi:hypothetical protein
MLMRKIIVCSIILLAIGAFAFGDTCLCLSGDVTLKWGIKGEFVDNSANFLHSYGGNSDDDIEGTAATLESPFASDEGAALNLAGTATASYSDGDTVIVEAQAAIDLLEAHDTDTFADIGDDSRGVLYWDAEDDQLELIDRILTDAEDACSYTYIKFPNVVPGILGITLNAESTLTTAVTATESDIEQPNMLVTITPPLGDAASVKAELGLTWQTDPLMVNVAVDNTLDAGNTTFDSAAELNIGTDPWVKGYVTNVAFSIYAEVDVPLSDMGNVYGGVGMIIDTSYTGEITDMADKDATTELALENGADASIEMWAPYVSYELDEDMVDEDTGEAIPGAVHGFATIPIGVKAGTGLTFGDIGVNAELLFQTRLVDGWDELDTQEVTFAYSDDPDDMYDYTPYTPAPGGLQFDDIDEVTLYAMPMHVSLDVGADIAMADMTIAPSANFKMTTDYWKWGLNDDDDGIEYKGNVSGTDFAGRMMSTKVSIDASNIAGMIDASLSFGMGFGDSPQVHGATDPGEACCPVLMQIMQSYGEYTWLNECDQEYLDAKADGEETWSKTVPMAMTMSDLILFAQEHLNTNVNAYWAGEEDSDNLELGANNEGLLAWTDANAYELSLSITLTPPQVAGLSISNETSMTYDPLASLAISYDVAEVELNPEFTPGDDPTADYNWFMYTYVDKDYADFVGASTLTNTTTVRYGIMAGDQTAATLYGILTAKNEGFLGELGEFWSTSKYDADLAPGGFIPMEQVGVFTFDYEFGVEVTATIE